MLQYYCIPVSLVREVTVLALEVSVLALEIPVLGAGIADVLLQSGKLFSQS